LKATISISTSPPLSLQYRNAFSPITSTAGRTATDMWRTRSMTRTTTSGCSRARQACGRVAIANSDAAGDAYAHLAIDQAARAVRELVG
jgi:hypothetical protein